MGRGSSIQFLSAFPGEAEVLFPPLTYLECTSSHPEEVVVSDDIETATFRIVEVIPHFGT